MKLKLLFLSLAAIVAVKTQAQQSDEINQVIYLYHNQLLLNQAKLKADIRTI